jgi:hypothetical protein
MVTGLRDPKIRFYPLHNRGWPVDVMPFYR